MNPFPIPAIPLIPSLRANRRPNWRRLSPIVAYLSSGELAGIGGIGRNLLKTFLYQSRDASVSTCGIGAPYKPLLARRAAVDLPGLLGTAGAAQMPGISSASSKNARCTPWWSRVRGGSANG